MKFLQCGLRFFSKLARGGSLKPTIAARSLALAGRFFPPMNPRERRYPSVAGRGRAHLERKAEQQFPRRGQMVSPKPK